MPRKPISTAGRTVRIAWPAAAAVPMVLLALAAIACPAAALGEAPASPSLASIPGLQSQMTAFEEAEDETYEGEAEEGEDPVEEDEAEEGEDPEEGAESEEAGTDEEEGAGERSPFPPDECLLRSARSRVSATPAQSRVRLEIRYTASGPADVGVSYRLSGGRGSLALGKARRRLSTEGRLVLTTQLERKKMERVLAAKSFSVELTIPDAPAYCRRFYTRRLSIKRTAPHQISWLQAGSIFGL